LSDIMERLLKEKDTKDFVRAYFEKHKKVDVNKIAKQLDVSTDLLLSCIDSLIKTGEIPPLTDEEPIQMFSNTLVKFLKSWKDYPFDQWMREEEMGRVLQAFFNPPKRCKCGGQWHHILTAKGHRYICDKCALNIPVVSHRVFWTDKEETVTHQV